MGKRITMFLFVIPLLVLSSLVDVKAEARKTLSEVDRKLKLLNKPAIKSIKVYFFYYFNSPLSYYISIPVINIKLQCSLSCRFRPKEN